MKQKAIKEASIRLERAREALAVMEKNKDNFSFAEFESAWWSFLLAANGIYAKLEQGSKSNGRSIAWFGRVKHLRKTDELLSYIHHARNSEEHSLEGSTHQTGIELKPIGRAKLVPPPDGTGEPRLTIPSDAKSGEAIAQIIAPHIRLRPVTDDRYGDAFYPPQRHMGQPIAEQDRRPAGIARLAFAYLESLIDEASKLPE